MRLWTVLTALLLMSPAQAQFVTADQVRPILQATEGNWIGVRRWEGNDLLYFTHLESWRCGLSRVRYGINSKKPTQDYELDECFEDKPNPNILDVENHLPYVTLPLDSVETIVIEVTYDDGQKQTAFYNREKIEIP